MGIDAFARTTLGLDNIKQNSLGEIGMRLAAWSLLLLCGAALGGCEGGLDIQSRRLGLSSAIFTPAEYRMIQAAPQQIGPDGRSHPVQVTCAEPSPDVAKAISTAFGAGGAVTVNVNGPGLPADPAQVAAAVSGARAEALAQLGERMASIQLLRDGLYRACEGFQNGALDKISYSLVLSKIGDTMVSMLGSELIAGEFGRTGASAGGTAAGSGSASFGPPTKEEKKAATDDVVAKQKALTDAQVSEDKKAAEVSAATAEPDRELKEKQLNDLKAETKGKREELAVAQRKAAGLATAAASSSATASGTGIGGLSVSPGDRAVNRISDIVRQYLQMPNIHSMMTACVAAMSDSSYNASALTRFCVDNMNSLATVIGGAYRNSYGEIAQDANEARQRELLRQVRELQRLVASIRPDAAPPAAGRATEKKLTR